MNIKLALTSDPKDDGYIIIGTLKEDEVRAIVNEGPDQKHRDECDCAVCQFVGGLDQMVKKIDQN